MRGLDTAFPVSVRGWSLSYNGHRHVAGLQAALGSSPPWPRPNLAQRLCSSLALIPLLIHGVRAPCCYVLCGMTEAGSTSRAIAHRKAAISRAIAVIATVLRFPFAVRRR
jgi:hypothetical protein